MAPNRKKTPEPPPQQPVQIRHLGSGKYSDVFRVQPRGSTAASRAVAMKVSYYRTDTLCDIVKRKKKGDLKGAAQAKKQDSIQVSSTFAKLTMSLLDRVSPHFVVVFCDRDCSSFAPRLQVLLKDRLNSLNQLQKRYNNVCFMELFHGNLTSFLAQGKYSEQVLRSIVFQVLYTLAALQAMLPGFRHNDLSTNNVLIKKLTKAPNLTYATGDGWVYRVSMPYLVALSDYDFTHVPDRPGLVNERVLNGRYKVDGRKNDSYDAHFFLKSVLKCIQRRPKEFPKTWEFLHRLRMRSEDRQNSTYMPRLKPATLLKDAYFAPLRAATGTAATYTVPPSKK